MTQTEFFLLSLIVVVVCQLGWKPLARISKSDTGMEQLLLAWIITIVLVLINVGIAIAKAFIS